MDALTHNMHSLLSGRCITYIRVDAATRHTLPPQYKTHRQGKDPRLPSQGHLHASIIQSVTKTNNLTHHIYDISGTTLVDNNNLRTNQSALRE